MRLFLFALGLVLIMEGLLYFAFPEKVKVLLLRIRNTSEGALRVLGFTAMLTGLILVCFGKG